MQPDFTQATHTFIISDLHLADAEPPHPRNPLWKRFKRPRFFIDRTVSGFLDFIQSKASAPIELILNGDIFDFDSVMAMPKPPNEFKLSWLERRRGLKPQEEKSRFKLRTILDDHQIWTEAMKRFISAGNRIVFVIGNHDIELHWPSVQNDLCERLGSVGERAGQVRFVEWFYVSNRDTLIEHGNQYDAYSLCSNPVHPLIRDRGGVHLRLPFGNLAGKFMLNGMGLMNPHIEASYIKDSFGEYMEFFFKYVVRTQPFLAWTWFWSAGVTLIVSVGEGFRPAMSDPFTVGERIEGIAERSNGSSKLVLGLRELHAHPAYYNPLQILQELWLDRAIMLGLAVFIAFEFFSFMNVFINVSIGWFLVPLLVLLPIPIFYARSVKSEVLRSQAAAALAAPTAAKMAGVARVVHGHTHREMHHVAGAPDNPCGPNSPVEYLNPGTWSPAFHDVECTKRFGRKCFVWIRPAPGGGPRVAGLYEWAVGQSVPVTVNARSG